MLRMICSSGDIVDIICCLSSSDCPCFCPLAMSLSKSEGFGQWHTDPLICSIRHSISAFCRNRRLTTLSLTAGLGSDSVADISLGLEGAICIGHYDTDVSLLPWLRKLYASDMSVVHCGPDVGDILRIPLSSFPLAQRIIAGPPCIAWSRKGKRKSWDDTRSRPFVKVLEIIDYCAKEGTLEMFIIENVESFGHRQGQSSQTPLEEVFQWLRDHLPPGWKIRSYMVNTCKFALSHNRPRLYILGAKPKFWAMELPLVLPVLETQVRISDFLNLTKNEQGSCPCPLKDHGLRVNHQRRGTLLSNLRSFKIWYQREMADMSMSGKIAVFSIDRTPASVTTWSVTKHIDTTECLTATGPMLHLMSLGEGCDAIDSSVRLPLDRALLPIERGRLQGFPEWFIDINDSMPREAVHAFGNAMSIPVLAVAIYTCLELCWGLPRLPENACRSTFT